MSILLTNPQYTSTNPPYFPTEAHSPLDFFVSSADYNMFNFDTEYRRDQLQRMVYFRGLEQERQKQIAKDHAEDPGLLSLPVSQHLENMKDTVSGTIDDLQNNGVTMNTFTKDNRLFYIGLILIILYVLFLIISDL
jgi:hypothetical protein